MRVSLILTFLLSLSFAGISSAQAQEKFGNLLGCKYIDLTSGRAKGQSFLGLVQKGIVPQLNAYATRGYKLPDGNRLAEALKWVDKKVARQALASLKGRDKNEKIKNLKAIGDQLVTQTTNLYSLPEMLASTRLVKNRYKLSTYVGLASCAGSHLKLADDNYSYNVHYGTGAAKKDKQTGRSFGASRVYRAIDASYSHYLRTLEKYVRTSPENVKFFTNTIMETLTNSEPRGYSHVNDLGDAVLTDFFSIWTAEQARNLMDGRVDLHWDAALLQVTLLSAFHAGQNEIKLFYKDPLSGKRRFTNQTLKLAWPSKNHVAQTCDVDLASRKAKKASLTDYIGVHYAVYEHCGRSGINMSRGEWKLLGREITRHLMSTAKGAELVNNVRKHITGFVDLSVNERGKRYPKNQHDIFRELARFLVNSRAAGKIPNWYHVSRNTAVLLEYVRLNANQITAEISRRHP